MVMGGVRMLTGLLHDQELPWGDTKYIETREALLGEEESSLSRERRHRNWTILTICNALLFTGAVALCAITWGKYSGRNYCLKVTSTYSPVLDEMDMPLIHTILNGSLWIGENPSVWRGPPNSAETNAAWESFERVKPIALTKAQVLAMGKDPTIVSKFNDDYWHMGDDAYVGALDIFHQIHCLNELRQAAFSDWGRGGKKIPKWDDIHWVHLRHCTDMLMQNLLCNADAGFLTYNWLEHESHPFPDMSVHKQCRDWQQLVKYRDEHGVDEQAYINWKKPGDITQLQHPDEYWKHRGENDSPHHNK